MITFGIRFLYLGFVFIYFGFLNLFLKPEFDINIFFLEYTNLLSLVDLREESATKGMRTAFHPQAAVKNIEQYAKA